MKIIPNGIKVRENRKGNTEWTIQRHWQHWAYKKHDESKQNIKKTTQLNTT